MADDPNLTEQQRAALAAAKARVDSAILRLLAAQEVTNATISPQQRLRAISQERSACAEAFDADAAFTSMQLELLAIAESERGLDVSEARAILGASLASNRNALQVELDKLANVECALRDAMPKLS